MIDLKLITRKYKISLDDFEVLSENQNIITYLILSNSKYFILKVAKCEQAIVNMKQEVEILISLNNIQDNIPILKLNTDKSVLTVVNNESSIYGFMYPLINGQTIEIPNKETINLLIDSFTELTLNLKKIGQNITIQKELSYSEILKTTHLKLKSIVKDNHKLYKRINDIYIKLERFIKEYIPKIQLIHSDLHYGNILFYCDKIYFIDFGDCSYGDLLFEISGLMLSPYREKDQLIIINKLLENKVIDLQDVSTLKVILSIKQLSLIFNSADLKISEIDKICNFIEKSLDEYYCWNEVN